MTIPEVGICNVTINHKNKQKLCKLFIFPGNDLALLGTPEAENI